MKGSVLITIALAVAAVACSPARGDDGLPAFAYKSKDSLEAYRFAVANPDLLSQIPCYCGCAKLGEPHKSNKHCYLKDDGTFDEHASACDLCTKITLDAKAWQRQGLSVEEIRTRIDEKYMEYGPATDTPPVP